MRFERYVDIVKMNFFISRFPTFESFPLGHFPSTMNSIVSKSDDKMTQRPKSNPQMNLDQTTKPMKYKCTFSGTVSDVFKRRGWVEV
jgi:hypothetical protein